LFTGAWVVVRFKGRGTFRAGLRLRLHLGFMLE
jgi:hypothetical protein